MEIVGRFRHVTTCGLLPFPSSMTLSTSRLWDSPLVDISIGLYYQRNQIWGPKGECSQWPHFYKLWCQVFKGGRKQELEMKLEQKRGWELPWDLRPAVQSLSDSTTTFVGTPSWVWIWKVWIESRYLAEYKLECEHLNISLQLENWSFLRPSHVKFSFEILETRPLYSVACRISYQNGVVVNWISR